MSLTQKLGKLAVFVQALNNSDREPGWERQELKTLWDISQSLYQYLNINDLIQYILKQVTEVMDVKAVSVILHDEVTNEFIFCWSSDIRESNEKYEEIRFPADQGIAGRVFGSGNGELISDVKKDPQHFEQVDDVTNFSTKSMIAVPLKIKEKTIGVMEVLNKRNGIFNDPDLDFLVTLAPIIAMAIDNARMYSELNSAFKELQFIDKGKDDLIKQTKDEVALLRREVEKCYRFDKIIGNSERMIEVFKLCERVIDSDITVLIEGETGTGKELIANTIHYNSPRKNMPFVTQNCGGIPDTLLASELFGHKKGAYTGAFADKKGLFEIAHGGTVFLDEVAEMSAAMQTSLLRVLQEGVIKPLGSNQCKNVDLRLISATNKNLSKMAEEGLIREDLFYRLSVFTIELPPLRRRVADIPILANHFVKKIDKKTKKSIKGVTREAMECLSAYSFPGNVRELENEIERAIAMAQDGNFVGISDLSKKIRNSLIDDSFGCKVQGPLKERVETLEKAILLQSLQENGGNKTKAAKALGLSRNGLTKKIQRYGL